jgi:hypothetical protein
MRNKYPDYDIDHKKIRDFVHTVMAEYVAKDTKWAKRTTTRYGTEATEYYMPSEEIKPGTSFSMIFSDEIDNVKVDGKRIVVNLKPIAK